MKKISTLLACLLMGGASAIAQQHKDLREAMRESLQETLKEKLHPTKIPIGAKTPDKFAKGAAVTTEGRISATGNNIQEGEVSLAYHPLDSNKLVISYMEQTTTGLNFPIYYSSNGGQTWTKSSFSSTNILASDAAGQFVGGGGDPVFAWDKNGRLYYSWIYLTVNQAQDSAFWYLYWGYSDNNGQTWNVTSGANHFIGRGVLDLSTGGIFNLYDGVTDRQWMTVDNTGGPNQGKLYCSFLMFPSDGDPNKFGEGIKTKTFGATSFGPTVIAYNGQTQFGNVEVVQNGTLHLTLTDINDQSIQHVSSSNGGTSFSAAHLIANGSNLFGQTGTVHERENAATNLAVDGAGNLHIVWSSFPTTGIESFYSKSTDGGVTWSTPMNLSTPLAGRTAFMPTVAAYGNRVSISMSGVGIGSDDSSNYYQIFSEDNGTNWSWPVKVSNGQGNYKSYVNAEFFGDYNRSQRTACMTYAAWSDGRNGKGPKMYFARTNSCNPTSVREVTSVNGNLQLESMYPNPASTQVTLKLNANTAGKFTAQLIDMTGKVLLKSSNSYTSGKSEISLPLGHIAAGSYMLSLTDNEGGMITRQIIVR